MREEERELLRRRVTGEGYQGRAIFSPSPPHSGKTFRQSRDSQLAGQDAMRGQSLEAV